MKRQRVRVWLASGALLGMAGTAGAVYETERLEFRPSVSAQGTFQHDAVESIDAVQERNELRMELKYRLIPREGRFGIFSILDVNMLYRGRYDSIFDIRDAYRKRGYNRDDFRFPEGKVPRELFLDVGFNGLLRPLSLRLGRQQVVWGEADLFRSIDVVNPLRLDQNGLIGEDLSDYREPLWIAKGLLDIGSFGPIAETGLEFFYSPNWRPLTDRIAVGEGFRIKLDHTRVDDPTHLRRNFVPFNQVRYPWEVSRVSPFATEAQDGAETDDCKADGTRVTTGGPCLPNQNPGIDADFMYIIDSKQVPTSVVDLDASMFGARLLGKTFANLDFSVNYIFKRTEVPGTVLPGHLIFNAQNPQNGDASTDINNTRPDVILAAATVPAAELRERCINNDPRVFDLDPLPPLDPNTANVAILDSVRGYPTPLAPDRDAGEFGQRQFTGCLTVPFWYPWTHILGGTLTYNDYDFTGMILRLEQSWSSKEPRNGVPALAGVRAGDFPGDRDFATANKRSTQVWRSMVGFDYLRAFPNLTPPFFKRYKYLRTWFYDQWFFTFQFLNEYYSHADSQIGLLDSISDRMQHYNPVFTFVATGFFLNNLFRPWIAAGYDVNAAHPLAWLQGTYFLSPQLQLRVGEILYMGSSKAESFLFLHKYADRDTTFVRLTYFML